MIYLSKKATFQFLLHQPIMPLVLTVAKDFQYTSQLYPWHKKENLHSLESLKTYFKQSVVNSAGLCCMVLDAG
jgi:hypothetical protein